MGFCDCVMLASESDQRACFFFFWYFVLLGRNCLEFSIDKGVALFLVKVSLCYSIVHSSVFD